MSANVLIISGNQMGSQTEPDHHFFSTYIQKSLPNCQWNMTFPETIWAMQTTQYSSPKKHARPSEHVDQCYHT
ncbi:hypothetical protein M0802_011801 [Mischocyttarus mexicanus]|nr:hypothetical protein M0802_011801 [Mischocyttarus mexicanus]